MMFMLHIILMSFTICIGIELYGYVYLYIYIYNYLYGHNVCIQIINEVHCVQLCKLVLLGLTGISLHFLGIFSWILKPRLMTGG